jgi:hypothetical protein
MTVCGGGRSGVGGAKGEGQGEYAPAKHVLDSEPGSRVKGAGTYTATRAVAHPRQEPYAGSRPYSSMQGHEVTRVPAANRNFIHVRYCTCSGLLLAHKSRAEMSALTDNLGG